jgi:hypothetical protein
MLPEKVNDLYSTLRATIMNFKSPAFREYFLKKADDDFYGIELKTNGEKRPCAMKRYLEEQSELLDVLKRQTVIYNMFYDDKNRI